MSKPQDTTVLQDVEWPNIPALGIFDAVECERRVGESLFETAYRILLYESLARTNNVQKDAAKILRVSPRIMNHHCKNFSIRRKDINKK